MSATMSPGTMSPDSYLDTYGVRHYYNPNLEAYRATMQQYTESTAQVPAVSPEPLRVVKPKPIIEDITVKRSLIYLSLGLLIKTIHDRKTK